MSSFRSYKVPPLSILQALRGRRARILCYHSISASRQDRWVVGTRQFAAHLSLLRQEGWAILPLQELVARLKDGQGCVRSVALTFDDPVAFALRDALSLVCGAAVVLAVAAAIL